MTDFKDATLVYRLFNLLGRFCFRAFGRLEIAGVECVPQYGPLIVVSNHLSLNDPPLLVAALPRPLFFIGKKELFGSPVSRFLMRVFHVSRFDRSAAGIDAVRVLMQNLERDRAVVIFPEGTDRNRKIPAVACPLPFPADEGQHRPAVHSAGDRGQAQQSGDVQHAGYGDGAHSRSTAARVPGRLRQRQCQGTGGTIRLIT